VRRRVHSVRHLERSRKAVTTVASFPGQGIFDVRTVRTVRCTDERNLGEKVVNLNFKYE